MSAVTMNAITVKASAFTAGRVSLRAKSAVAAKPRGMTVMAFKVTLDTPEGQQVIECADDTYILDAAEVRVLVTSYQFHLLDCAVALWIALSPRVVSRDGSCVANTNRGIKPFAITVP